MCTDSLPPAASLLLIGLVLTVVACGPKPTPATPTPAPPPPVTAPVTPATQSAPAPRAVQPAQPAAMPPAAASVAATPASTSTAPVAPRPPAVPPLVGQVTRASLRDYAPWQPVLAQVYAPDPAAVAIIKAALRDVTVLAIVATWCPDTKRELPRFFAIMDAAGLPESVLTMVGVDRTKKDADGLTEKWVITRVPTFVFLRGGVEIGRFVERVPPESTLEREIERSLRGQKY